MFKCKICGKKYTELTALYNHIESKHKEMIPKDMSVQQYYYYMKTGKMNGNCVMCKQPTSWNSNTGKYNRFCGNPKCKDEYVKIMKGRMVAKYGKTHLLNDPNKQREMLANRSISGVYKWSDGKHESTYTGSYELDFLKTLDGFFNWDPEDISMPSPHTYTYKYEGEDKFYIPDVFIHSLDLEIEIKDGGDNPNNHYKIQAVDKHKEALKDEVMCSQKAFHYIKITNKNYENFFQFLKEIKKEFEKHNDESKIPRIFKIEDIKGTNVKPIQESLEDVSKGIEKFENFSNVEYRKRDAFLSLRYDLVKNDPRELQDYLSKLIKAAKFEDDIWYVQQMAKKADDHYKKRLRNHPEMKDVYGIYYDWLKDGGIDKEIKKRRKDGVKLIESFEAVEENLLFSHDNIEFNIEKFGKEYNTLYITGLGGSGKSTIIKEYAAKYKAEALEFDAVTSALIKGLENLNRDKIHPIILEYLETQNPNRLNGFGDPKFVSESVKFLDWFEAKVSGDDKLYILEGMQLFICFEPERFTGRPMVVMGTSVVKSMYRSNLRVYKRSEGDIIKTFKFFLKTLRRTNIFIKNDKQINNLINTLNESLELIEEKMNIDRALVWLEKPIEKLTNKNIKIYRGSSVLIDDVIEPRSINVGSTRLSNPRWSTYFWDNKEDAIKWEVSQVMEDRYKYTIYIGHEGKTLLGKPKDVKEKEFVKSIIADFPTFYVYEADINIHDLEMGSGSIIREYVVSKPVNITKRYEYKLNKELVRRCFQIVDIEAIEKMKEQSKGAHKLDKFGNHRNPLLSSILDNNRDLYRAIIRTDMEFGNVKVGDDLSGYRKSINYNLDNNTYGTRESYIIDRMEESSISIPQMSYYLQNQYEEDMRDYLNTYKKYYNLMLKEQPAAVKHINEDIRQCLIVIDGLAAKGVENNLVQFAKDDLGEIVKASKKGKPVKVYESMVEDMVNIDDSTNDIHLITVQNDNVSISNEIIECKLVYNNTTSKQLFSLRDVDSKLIIENSYVIQRDSVGTHCSVTPYYTDIRGENSLSFYILLNESVDISELSNKINKGITLTNLFKFNDNGYNFIKESCLRLFDQEPIDVIMESADVDHAVETICRIYKKAKDKYGDIECTIDEFLFEPREYFVQIWAKGKNNRCVFKKSFIVDEYPDLDKKLSMALKKIK
jgi:hypothetical protein